MPDACLWPCQKGCSYKVPSKICGFDGPYSGGKHSFMVKEGVTLTIPNPHHKDIGKEFLTRILRQAGVSKEEWEKL